MKFMRNPGVKKQMFMCLMLTVILSAAGFLIFGAAGFAVMLCCFIFSFFDIWDLYKRYNRIAQFGSELESILYGEYIELSGYEEGELAILQNQIQKLVLQMRRQADLLVEDKIYLADSMADISHQLKTPITSMNLIASMLSDEELTYGRRSELTKELSKLLGRMEWQVQTLLKISRLDAGTVIFRRDAVSVGELVKKSYDTVAIPMELREQEFSFVSAGDEKFTGDLSWTMEAVSNILKNCMEHTPAGGTITVEASENAVFTEIIISNNGVGIAKEDLPHLFERFYKGKNAGNNSIGIGLALARMIITGQNGVIKAENNRTCGARFTIRFYKVVV